MRKILSYSILFSLLLLHGCKKEETRPKIKDTDESKISEFIKIVPQSISKGGVNLLAIPAFAFAHPVEKEFVSSNGNKMIYKIMAKTVSPVPDNLQVLDGIWQLNATNDTLFFTPAQVFTENENVKFLIDLKLYYSDDKDYSLDYQEFKYEETFRITKPEIKSSPAEYFISPFTNSIEFNFEYKIGEQVNLYNRVLKFDLYKLSLIDSVKNTELNININSPQGNNLKIDIKDRLQSLVRLNAQFIFTISEFKQGTWKPLLRNASKVVLFDTVRYKTKVYFLDKPTIVYSYPIDRQYFFLKGESSKGYVKLYEPSSITQESGFTYKARYILLKGDSTDVDLSFNTDSNCFNYSIPQTLLNRRIYRLKFIASKNGSETVFYDIYFRTSGYNKFEDKWKSVSFNSEVAPLNDLVLAHQINDNSLTEGFDTSETTSLIKIEDLINNYAEYASSDYPRFYQNCKDGKIILTWRTEKPAGFPPVHGSYIDQSEKIRLEDREISGNSTADYRYPARVIYTSFYYLRKDYSDASGQIQFLGLNCFNPLLYAGTYYYNVYYVLPNGTKTFEKQISFTY